MPADTVTGPNSDSRAARKGQAARPHPPPVVWPRKGYCLVARMTSTPIRPDTPASPAMNVDAAVGKVVQAEVDVAVGAGLVDGHVPRIPTDRTEVVGHLALRRSCLGLAASRWWPEASFLVPQVA